MFIIACAWEGPYNSVLTFAQPNHIVQITKKMC